MVAGCLPLSLPVLRSSCLSLTVSYGCSLCLTISLVPRSCYKSLTVSYCCELPFTVSPNTIGYLPVSHSLLWLLAFSHCLSRCNGVDAYYSLSPMGACYLSLSLLFHGVAGSLSPSLMVAGFLSVSLTVTRICCMSLTVSYGCWLSITVSSGTMKLLAVTHCLFQYY